MTFFPFKSNAATESGTVAPSNRLYRFIWVGLVMVLIGIVVYNVFTYYQAQERRRVVNARTEMVKAQARANQLTLLSEDTIKKIAALNTGVPIENLRFIEIGLITFDDLPMPSMALKQHVYEHHRGTDISNEGPHTNFPEDNNSDASLPPIKMPPDMKSSQSEGKQKSVAPAASPNSTASADSPNSAEVANAQPSQNEGPGDPNNMSPSRTAQGPTNNAPSLPENDFSRTPPGELKTHPLYHVFARSGGLTYELIIDGVNGHIIKSNVY
ncbi:hypothetical protein [uncultured Veillonella sp.]|uniref:hypothetical protein n=1 Tax=uncultured Veillonella sp. TaxID=159268 RepID=UPI0026107B7F|nr:hypothetical protein [uncultured Veillonella sp.]